MHGHQTLELRVDRNPDLVLRRNIDRCQGSNQGGQRLFVRVMPYSATKVFCYSNRGAFWPLRSFGIVILFSSSTVLSPGQIACTNLLQKSASKKLVLPRNRIQKRLPWNHRKLVAPQGWQSRGVSAAVHLRLGCLINVHVSSDGSALRNLHLLVWCLFSLWSRDSTFPCQYSW